MQSRLSTDQSRFLRSAVRVDSMTQPFGRMPSQEIEDKTTEWWKERIEMLIQVKQPQDAKALYLEFTDYQSERLKK